MLSHQLSTFFQFKKLQTDFKKEIIAGMTTFLTMVYVAMVNPAILSQAGISPHTAFFATCLVAAFGSILCGLLSNFPIALAPSMGLNAYFTFSVVKGGQLGLGQALACVVVAGIIFLLLTIFRIRDWLLNAIPPALCHAIGAGIGLFIGFVGLKILGVIVPAHDTFITLGNITSPAILLSFIGFCGMVILDYYQIPGAILLSIIVIAIFGNLFGLQTHADAAVFSSASTWGWQLLDFHGLLTPHSIMIIVTFLLVALFDSTGTLLSLLYQAKLTHQPHILKKLSAAFYAESVVTIAGGLLGTSTVGPYVENASGIAAGGRSGVTAITVGILFLITLCFAYFASSIPVFAYAPALVFVAYKMCAHLAKIDWANAEEGVPAVLIILLIPLTFSIANGIACGFIVYMIIKIACKKIKTLHWSSWTLFSVFIMYLALLNR